MNENEDMRGTFTKHQSCRAAQDLHRRSTHTTTYHHAGRYFVHTIIIVVRCRRTLDVSFGLLFAPSLLIIIITAAFAQLPAIISHLFMRFPSLPFPFLSLVFFGCFFGAFFLVPFSALQNEHSATQNGKSVSSQEAILNKKTRFMQDSQHHHSNPIRVHLGITRRQGPQRRNHVTPALPTSPLKNVKRPWTICPHPLPPSPAKKGRKESREKKKEKKETPAKKKKKKGKRELAR